MSVLMEVSILVGEDRAACKESTVRQPGASGFCYWASEFCFSLARNASDVL